MCPDDDVPEFEGTRVDLGEDLIEKTAILPGVIAPAPPPTPAGTPFTPPPLPTEEPVRADTIEDNLETARILVGEGLLEDAKKILRHILIVDGHEIRARKLLNQVHETELKQIFGEGPARRSLRNQEPTQTMPPVDADVVMRSLDADLGLGIFLNQLSLFRDSKELEAFAKKLDLQLASLDVQGHTDVGIAFFEMDLFELAVRRFAAACRMLEGEEHSDPAIQKARISATSLHALALIHAERGFEATAALQPALGDVEIPREEKKEMLYLMARAYETMRKPALALQYYLQVAGLDPQYRDVQERLRKK